MSAFTSEQRIKFALSLLYRARDQLKLAKAPRATAKVRAAITSTQGAARHAALAPYRELPLRQSTTATAS